MHRRNVVVALALVLALVMSGWVAWSRWDDPWCQFFLVMGKGHQERVVRHVVAVDSAHDLDAMRGSAVSLCTEATHTGMSEATVGYILHLGDQDVGPPARRE